MDTDKKLSVFGYDLVIGTAKDAVEQLGFNWLGHIGDTDKPYDFRTWNVGWQIIGEQQPVKCDVLLTSLYIKRYETLIPILQQTDPTYIIWDCGICNMPKRYLNAAATFLQYAGYIVDCLAGESNAHHGCNVFEQRYFLIAAKDRLKIKPPKLPIKPKYKLVEIMDTSKDEELKPVRDRHGVLYHNTVRIWNYVSEPIDEYYVKGHIPSEFAGSVAYNIDNKVHRIKLSEAVAIYNFPVKYLSLLQKISRYDAYACSCILKEPMIDLWKDMIERSIL